MARSRNIKPGFFTNADLIECEPLARLLFAGLWCEADRRGILEDRPKTLKIKILPGDNCDVGTLLTELEQAGFIQRYEASGHRCILIRNFEKHQHPHQNELPNNLPAPEQHQSTPVAAPEQSGLLPITDSLLPITENGLPLDQPSVESANAPKTKRATRIPEDFAVTDDLWNWAAAEGFTSKEIDTEVESFKDYWRAKPGKEGTKLDWVATWRSWMRNSRKFGPRGSPNGTARPKGRMQEDMDMLIRVAQENPPHDHSRGR
jgi:hypothetical protein